MRLLIISALLLLMPALVEAADQPSGTRINLSATAETTLANDEVIISLRVEKQGEDAAVVRHYVNRVSGSIAKILASENDVKLQTVSRSMQPVWKHAKGQPRQRIGWKMIQRSQITTSRLQDMPRWLDAIESAGAQLSSLNFRISAAAEKQARAALSAQAIHHFRDKAAALAKSLDAKSFRILRLNTASNAVQPRIYRAEMMMSRATTVASSPPALAVGENRISVSVSGEIELPFIDFPAR